MKILKLLNKKYFSILIFYLLSATNTFAEDKPVDIWNLEKKETDIVVETSITDQNQFHHCATAPGTFWVLQIVHAANAGANGVGFCHAPAGAW